ncbi:MAG: FAD-dependent oxidoreductase [Clostridia bacterium]|nr:MAG: FAD-dependent oxidoreductase [Clostridia bacterium]
MTWYTRRVVQRRGDRTVQLQRSEPINCDVLVVGGGLAGIMAAIGAKDFANEVILVEKGKVSRSGATVFTHGALGPASGDEKEVWVQELAEHSTYLCDQEWTEILVTEQRDRINDLASWGVPLQRSADGSFITESGRGQRQSKIVLYDGKKMMEVLRKHALQKGVNLVEKVAVVDLLTSDGRYPTEGRVTGAIGVNVQTGEIKVISCNAIVLATGMGSLKLHALNMDNVTGDGQAMAYRVGAELAGLEFAMAPTFSIWNRYFCTPSQSQFQSHGAKIVNSVGERIIEKYFPGQSEQSLDFGTLCRMVAKETLEGRGPIYFDLREWSDAQIDKMRAVQPRTMKGFDRAGVDIKKQLIETTPMMTGYSASGEGGIRIGKNADTSVTGLYAAGVCALIAANISSLMGVPQAFCSVAGYRAGENAGKLSTQFDGFEINTDQVELVVEHLAAPFRREVGLSPQAIWHKVHEVILPLERSFFKEEQKIKEVISLLQSIAAEDILNASVTDPHDLVKLLEVRNIVQLSELVYLSALERKESRLTHYRTDYPFRDNEQWLKWVVIRRRDGGPEVSLEALPLSSYKFKPSSTTVNISI